MLHRDHASDHGLGSDTAGDKALFGGNQVLNTKPVLAVSYPGASPPQVNSTNSTPRASFEGSLHRHSCLPAPPILKVQQDEHDPKEIILQSFFPKVAIHASEDTEELVRLKGIYGGFCGLLKPFGEKVQGKVVIRDSVGASKSWDDFGVHFMKIGNDADLPSWTSLQASTGTNLPKQFNEFDQRRLMQNTTPPFPDDRSSVDEVIDCHLRNWDSLYSVPNGRGSQDNVSSQNCNGSTPPYHTHYLRKILSDRSMVPHETFSHPVACIIAVSSQNPSPIETLRELYREASSKVPIWAGNDFLRYYILVHDEDHDDMTSSITLFNQMKRHFGLHCHLLRLRSVDCGPEEEDKTELPSCAWLSAAEELLNIRRREQDGGVDDFKQYLYNTDVAVIKTFVREMVTQSIVPFMEGRVTTWNDQIASNRRGIGGRFMSLSKRFTGFGSTRASKSSLTSSSGPTYFSVHGHYEPISNEVMTHRLADYAFMLRDWKLSSGIYNSLSAAFGDDKAWLHHAIVNEMTVYSLLLNAQSTGSKLNVDIVDQLLDSALYSYITRCAIPRAAVRCLVVAIELHIQGSGLGLGEANKWAVRLLELSIMTPMEQVLLTERIALCHNCRRGSGQQQWGSRTRKAAFYNLLATKVWLSLDQPRSASRRLRDAAELYGLSPRQMNLPRFTEMQAFWQNLAKDLAATIGGSTISRFDNGNVQEIDEVDEEIEVLNRYFSSQKSKGDHTVNSDQLYADGGSQLQERMNSLDQDPDGFA